MKLALYIFTGITFLLSLGFLVLSAVNKEKKFYFKTLLFLALCVYSIVGLVFLTDNKSDDEILGKVENAIVLEPIFREINTDYSIDLYKVVLIKTNQSDIGTLIRYAKMNQFSDDEKIVMHFFEEDAPSPIISDEERHNAWLSFLSDDEKASIIGTYELTEDGMEYWYQGDNATIVNPENEKQRSPINTTRVIMDLSSESVDENNAYDVDDLIQDDDLTEESD